MESCSDLARFLQEIISKLEEGEKLSLNPVVPSTPFMIATNPFPMQSTFSGGKICFTAMKRRSAHSPTLNAPYFDPLIRKMLPGNRRQAAMALRSCMTRSWLFNDQSEFELALVTNSTERVECLINKGTVYVNGWEYLRPLHVAAEHGFTDLAKLLLRKGADPNLRNRIGDTPLQVAARKNHYDVVKVLLEAGAVPDTRNYFGKNAVQVAGSNTTGDGDPLFMELRKRIKKQVIELVTNYVNKKRKETAEDELLKAFETRLQLSENKTQLKDELGSMVAELSSLSITNSNSGSSEETPVPTVSN